LLRFLEWLSVDLLQGIEFDDVVVTCATGGTVAGLTIANYLAGQPYK